MAEVLVAGEGLRLACADGEPVLEALLGAGVLSEAPCGGRGTCGKCRVRFLAGAPAPSEADLGHLGAGELAAGWRLACQARAGGEMVVERSAQPGGLEALSGGAAPEVELSPAFSGLGLAADVGTTTVVVSLVDAASGSVLASASGANAQRRFGADVLTRISYESEHPESGAAELQAAIVGQLNELAARACAQAGASLSQVREADVAANATMAHMLLGADARGIGRAPYEPAFTGAQDVPAASVGLALGEGARLYCLPAASAFIGSDVVAGVFACGLLRSGRPALLVDVGTNGEMVLAAGGRLLGCSCAAGPALEGMGVACGMRAASGAVEEVRIAGGEAALEAIGGLPPAGLCGSGVLAAVRELLRAGLVRPDGRLARPGSLPAGDPRRALLADGEGGRRCLLGGDGAVYLTQRDLRQVQLAKGAILSGALALLGQAGLRPEELGRAVVAGQFGAHLSEESLLGCGILPAGVAGRVEYAGNSALGGVLRVGVDIGSTAAKAAVMDDGRLVDTLVMPTGFNSADAAARVAEALRARGHGVEGARVVATGYGRVSVPYAAKTVTEITCHGRGAAWLFGPDGLVIDVGGQDTKVIQLVGGKVRKFVMNDKCAAGTGKFLEVMADRMGLTQERLAELARAGKPTRISSMCTVFAESEVVSLVGRGEPLENIANGVIESVVSRVAALAAQVPGSPCFLTGGLCENAYVVERLAERLGQPVRTEPRARFAGAIGAALSA